MQIAFADLTMHAHCLGKAASMMNDIDGFRNPDGTAVEANVVLETKLVEEMPVVLVRATRDIAAHERLLLSYDWKEDEFKMERERVMAGIEEMRMALKDAFRIRDELEQSLPIEEITAVLCSGHRAHKRPFS